MAQSTRKKLEGREGEATTLMALYENQFTVADRMGVKWSPPFANWLKKVGDNGKNHQKYAMDIMLEPNISPDIHNDPFTRLAVAIANKISRNAIESFERERRYQERIAFLEEQIRLYQLRDNKSILPGAMVIVEACKA